MSDDIKPFHLLRHDHGKSSLFFSADAFYHDPVMAILVASTGIDKDYFNGHAWKRIVTKFVMQEYPEVLAQLQFDPEADMFSMIAEDHALLERIAHQFRAFLRNGAAVEALLMATQ